MSWFDLNGHAFRYWENSLSGFVYVGLDPEPVVHGLPEPLLAVEVALSRLARHVPTRNWI